MRQRRSKPGFEPGRAARDALARALLRLERRLREMEEEMRLPLRRVAPKQRESAQNLVHYIALRQHDLRNLQRHLSQNGLSSLGRSESCVLGSVLEVSARAQESVALAGGHPAARRELARLALQQRRTLSWEAASQILHQHTRDVLGPRPPDRHIYIMVTAPSAREADAAWMAKLLRAGMNVLRINCAHEGEREWAEMIRALRAARAQTGKSCRVLMDLAGPKIRIGAVANPRPIATWKPTKDDLGRVTAPARVLLRRAGAPRPADADAEADADPKAALVIRGGIFGQIRKGDELHFRDARDKKRVLAIADTSHDQLVALGRERAYLLERAPARLYRRARAIGRVTLEVRAAGSAVVDVKAGEKLRLTARATEGQPPRRDPAGRVVQPGVVRCTLPAALEHLAVGQRVLFDDGLVESVVVQAAQSAGDYLLRVTRTQKKTGKLRAEKGINLPDTRTTIANMTAEDRRALSFVARHADAVGLSFVRDPEDLRVLHAALKKLGAPALGVVLKIETRAGFENLPRLLLEGLRQPPLAVMIARGDLAVNVGFERLAELQEEILWLCEAAHVPAIWATQVLDTLARTGAPSRAEVTDAAASVGAECVMLNKGPFVDRAVRALSGILSKMEKHHYKKRSLFRKLRVSTFDDASERNESRRARS